MPFKPMDFPRLQILTLHRRSDRLGTCIERIDAVERWPFHTPEPFYGIDGLAEGMYPPHHLWNEMDQPLSRGGWGCQMSFYFLFAKFIESGEPWLCILEDDACFVEDFTDKVVEYLAHVPDNADCIYIGGNPRSPKQYPPIEINAHVCRPWRVTATHFCIFNQRFARDAIRWFLSPNLRQMDAQIARLHSLKDPGNRTHGGKYNVYFPRRDLAGQVMGQSDIQIIDSAEIQEMYWGVGNNKLRPIGSDVTERLQGPIHGEPTVADKALVAVEGGE